MNFEGYEPAAVTDEELAVEDRWILSRLATVTAETTEALAEYRYADAARALYGFAWDEFCSFYLEMVKSRLGEAASRPAAQRVLAHTLDALLRLLHPMTPFVTEEVWPAVGRRGAGAGHRRAAASGRERYDRPLAAERPSPPQRADRGAVRPLPGGLAGGAGHSPSAERAADNADRLRRPLRRGDGSLLQPMEESFVSMAAARPLAWGPDVAARRSAPASPCRAWKSSSI